MTPPTAKTGETSGSLFPRIRRSLLGGWSAFSALLRFVLPYWPRFLFASLCMFGVAFFTAITTLMIKIVEDEVLPIHRIDPDRYLDFSNILGLLHLAGAPVSSFFSARASGDILSPFAFDALLPFRGMYWHTLIPFLIIGAFLAKSIFSYFRSYHMDYIGNAVIFDIKGGIYNQYLNLSMDFFSRNESGALASRITYDVELVRGAVSGAFSKLVQESMVAISCFVLMAAISPKLTLLSLVGFPFAIIPIVKLGQYLRKAARRIHDIITRYQD